MSDLSTSLHSRRGHARLAAPHLHQGNGAYTTSAIDLSASAACSTHNCHREPHSSRQWTKSSLSLTLSIVLQIGLSTLGAVQIRELVFNAVLRIQSLPPTTSGTSFIKLSLDMNHQHLAHPWPLRPRGLPGHRGVTRETHAGLCLREQQTGCESSRPDLVRREGTRGSEHMDGLRASTRTCQTLALSPYLDNTDVTESGGL